MKKIFSMFLAAGLLIAGCDKYDDSELRGKLDSHQSKLDDHAKRIAALESTVAQMNTNIASMQSILNALNDNDYVKSVTPIIQDGKEVGYIITFTKSGPVTIYHGKDGKNGADGKDGVNGKDGRDGKNGADGSTPQIGVRQDADGIYYWTLNGEWMTDASGKKIPATGPKGDEGKPGVGTPGSQGEQGAPGKDGVTPQLKIEDGYWFLSYDDGKTWTKLGKATGEDGNDGAAGEKGDTGKTGPQGEKGDKGNKGDKGDKGEKGDAGDSFFQSVNVTDKEITFTLADGTVFTLPVGVGPISFLDDAEQLISSTDRQVIIDVNEQDPGASYVASLEPVDAFFSTKAAGGWKVKLSMNTAGNTLIATVTPDEDTEMVLLTITRIASEGSHRISKILVNGTPKDLAVEEAANSYIVTKAGYYKFPTVKGNSAEPVGEAVSAEVLWETFGTDTAPEIGDLVSDIVYEPGYVSFKASDKKGNAVIAAKDASGEILWSWHIWMTDKPEDQVYLNDAGTMMDRNLGAISATPGDVGALGLFYQWGRKDPFMAAGVFRKSSRAVSTSDGIWETVKMDATTGTIDYAVKHPTSLINTPYPYEYGYDWLCESTKNKLSEPNRWNTSKTIYDPCPQGYRVCDGSAKASESHIWRNAFGVSGLTDVAVVLDDVNRGFDFGYGKAEKYLTNAPVCWYPASGFLSSTKSVSEPWGRAYYWTNFSSGSKAISIDINMFDGKFRTTVGGNPYEGRSVRCQKED